MRHRACAVVLAVTFGIAGAAASARAADLTGAYEGTLSLRKPRESAAVAGVLTQAGKTVTGTLAVNATHPTAGGVYSVTGVARGKKIVLRGANGSGVLLLWRGKVKGRVVKGKASMRGPGARLKARALLTQRSTDPPTQPRDACDNSFFTGQVMGRVLKPVCGNCHVAGGAAQSTAFRVTADDPIATQESVALQIDVAHPDESRILQKPLAVLPHGGGQQLSPGSEELGVLEQWVTLVANDQQCDGQADVTLVPLAAHDLLTRASMDLRGLRPAPAELDAVEADGGAYAALVDQYLHSPEFIERVKDAYDDALLVRREDDRDADRDQTWALYGEALELIAYIVEHDRPFTEIGTADYTVANELFQADPDRMPFPMTPVSGPVWQPAYYLDDRPHAGLLSTSAFYQVWDTNNTNVNRRRANRWSIVFHCYNFLDTPVDVTRNVDNNDADAVLNAVTSRSDCKACHDRLDPMASFLFPMDNARLEDDDPDDFYSGDPERWRGANRRPPAVYGVPGTDIRDMGRLLTQDPRFAECQTRRAFEMLFLRKPKTTAELAAAATIAQTWRTDDGYDFRALVRRWMLSDVYRSRPDTNDPEWVRRASPERLELLVRDLTGFVWSRESDDEEERPEPVPLLTTTEDGFKVILGGVNGETVSARSYSLNASVAMVQRKLAALAADYVVETDLALPDDQRRLLHGARGDEDPAVDEVAIRAVIVNLERRLTGERHAVDAPTVTVWFDLYRALHADDTQGGTGTNRVPGTPGERAWRGLVTAMLRSPRLLLY